MEDFEKYTIHQNKSIGDALKKINDNHRGIIIGLDSCQRVVGVATDGDIRRKLIAGIGLDESIMTCLNTKFVSSTPTTSREELLKKLDSKIKVIPEISADKKLINVIHRDNLPGPKNKSVYIRSRSPVRVSFAGGGSDLTPYFLEQTGVVLNVTIQKYCHVSLKVRSDSNIKVDSADLKMQMNLNNLDDHENYIEDFKLITAVIKLIKPTFGFDMNIYSDFNIGSGLGGSSAVCSAIIGCFNHLNNNIWSNYDIAEMAFQAERISLGVAGGWQDQYATVFGGMNLIEFDRTSNKVIPLKLKKEIILELEENLILCDTKIFHKSGEVHEIQRKNKNDKTTKDSIKKNVELANILKDSLIKGELKYFGEMLNIAWKLKKTYSSVISTDAIDEIYDDAMRNGAIGGKLLGAGAGGCFIFYVTPTHRESVIKALLNKGLTISSIKIDNDGLQTWNSLLE